ncbi:MAG: cytochrome c [Gammaproteobacteria bacterium]|nr:cytochrome c [Gammaproteobacteria bacterium]MDH5302491.1 cytochrome c [Gammaproteobacteria bacterium]MDH5321373.1 cytochrome c [Gammaproteobacteria bacterium]
MRNRAIFGCLCAAFAVYSSYVYTAGTAADHVPPMNDAERFGAKVYQQYNCVACHQFYGLGGYRGPDLTNVISNRGAGYARAFISAGTAAMPNLGLADNEIDAVLAYLAFVDRTGTYPAEDVAVHWNGTVAYQDDPH